MSEHACYIGTTAHMFMLLSRAYCRVSFSICVDALVCTMWEGM